MLLLLLSIMSIFRRETSANEIHISLFGAKGEISSPNYPYHYPLNVTMIWTIRTHPRNRIIIQFTDFELERVKRCIYDYVQLREDESTPWNSKQLKRYCGKSIPPDFITAGPKAQVKFCSDYYDFVAKGFKAFWIVVIGSPIMPTKSVTQFPHPPCSKETRTIILSKMCTTSLPSSKFKLEHRCKCKRGSKKDSSNSNSTVQTVMSTCQPSPIRSEYSTENIRSDGMSHLLSAFTAMLILFLLTTVILVFFLWRRRREVRYLKMARCQDPGLYPVLEWNLYKRGEGEAENRPDMINGYVIDPPADGLSQECMTRSSRCNTNSCKSRARTEGRSHHPCSRNSCVSKESQRYLTMLSDVTRQPISSLQYSDSEEDDNRDEHDTSDIYISTEFSSPTNSSGSYIAADRYHV